MVQTHARSCRDNMGLKRLLLLPVLLLLIGGCYTAAAVAVFNGDRVTPISRRWARQVCVRFTSGSGRSLAVKNKPPQHALSSLKLWCRIVQPVTVVNSSSTRASVVHCYLDEHNYSSYESTN